MYSMRNFIFVFYKRIQNMTKHNLIESFFSTPDEYLDFLLRLKRRVQASEDGKCFAILEKMDGDYYKYELSYGGKYIGDYVKIFRPTLENIDQFNEGCKILAERLEIYIETNDTSKVPENPPAFGDLTHVV